MKLKYVKLFESFYSSLKIEQTSFIEAEVDLSKKTGVVLMQVSGNRVDIDEEIKKFVDMFERKFGHDNVERNAINNAYIIKTDDEKSDVIIVIDALVYMDLSFWAKQNGAITIQEYFNKK